MKTQGEVEVLLNSFFNLGIRRGWLVNATLQELYGGKYPVPIVYEAGLAPGLLRASTSSLAPAGIRPSHGPAPLGSRHTACVIPTHFGKFVHC